MNINEMGGIPIMIPIPTVAGVNTAKSDTKEQDIKVEKTTASKPVDDKNPLGQKLDIRI